MGPRGRGGDGVNGSDPITSRKVSGIFVVDGELCCAFLFQSVACLFMIRVVHDKGRLSCYEHARLGRRKPPPMAEVSFTREANGFLDTYLSFLENFKDTQRQKFDSRIHFFWLIWSYGLHLRLIFRNTNRICDLQIISRLGSFCSHSISLYYF